MYPSNMAEVVITQATNADFKIDMKNSECKQNSEGDKLSGSARRASAAKSTVA